jgi:hypothetical protein
MEGVDEGDVEALRETLSLTEYDFFDVDEVDTVGHVD